MSRSSLLQPPKTWYLNPSPSSETPQPFLTYSDSSLLTGFNLTPTQFSTIDTRITSLLKINNLYLQPPTTYATHIAQWPILETLAQEFPFLLDDVPGWWAYDALKGWIAKVAVEMNERRFKNQLEGPPAKKKKKVKMQAAATGMIPLKHCHFVTTIRSTPGLASIIPLIDLLPAPKQPKSDSATDLQAWDLKSELLFGALYRDLGLGEGDRLVYTVTGVRGEKIDVGVGVGDDGGLRRAAMCLRRVGETGLFLEVIRSDDDIFTEHFDRYETPQPVPTLRTETPEVDIAQRIEPVIQTHLHSKESTPTIKREPDAEETIDLDLSSASNSPVSILKRRWDKDDENLVAESVDDEIAGLVGSEIRVPYSFSRRREASRRLQ